MDVVFLEVLMVLFMLPHMLFVDLWKVVKVRERRQRLLLKDVSGT
jgi:hypothetical protein